MSASPLHATRAGVGAAWCLALGLIGLCSSNPLLLVAVLAAEAAAAALAGVGRELRRTLRWALPFGVAIALVNALVDRNGVTVIARGPDLPWPGAVDITLEAVAYGAILALRALAIFLVAPFWAAGVDPDELLRGMRRVSLRSGVTAALAVRLGPVLRRDAQRLAEAQRCLPGVAPSRVAILRAVTSGALDRATDVAATLEVRGFGVARRPPRMARPWSRHDYAFAAGAAGLAAVAAGVLAGLWGGFVAYPRVEMTLDAPTVAAAVAILVCTLAPFADRRGIA